MIRTSLAAAMVLLASISLVACAHVQPASSAQSRIGGGGSNVHSQ